MNLSMKIHKYMYVFCRMTDRSTDETRISAHKHFSYLFKITADKLTFSPVPFSNSRTYSQSFGHFEL